MEQSSQHLQPPAALVQPLQFQQQSQPQYNNSQGVLYAQSNEPTPKSKAGILGLFGFILLGIVTAILLAVGNASIVGWFVSVGVVAGGLFIQSNLAKKECLLSIVLWVVTAGILFLTIGMTVNSLSSV